MLSRTEAKECIIFYSARSRLLSVAMTLPR